MAWSKNCGTTSHSNSDIIDILKEHGAFTTKYVGTDEDGFNGNWEICVNGSFISLIRFNNQKEIADLMNSIIHSWREEIKKNENREKTE